LKGLEPTEKSERFGSGDRQGSQQDGARGAPQDGKGCHRPKWSHGGRVDEETHSGGNAGPGELAGGGGSNRQKHQPQGEGARHRLRLSDTDGQTTRIEDHHGGNEEGCRRG
jgi:hypothetical protein